MDWVGLGWALTAFFVHHLEPLPLVCIDVHTNIILRMSFQDLT